MQFITSAILKATLPPISSTVLKTELTVSGCRAALLEMGKMKILFANGKQEKKKSAATAYPMKKLQTI